MEKVLYQILEELKEFKGELKGFKGDLKGFKGDLKGFKGELKGLKGELIELKEGQNRIEKKLNAVYEHTAKITEDITESNMKIDRMSEDIDFIKHKEQQTEQDLFNLKKNLEIIK